jgi:hypothetical protein
MHTDQYRSEVFFDELDNQRPYSHLGLVDGSHHAITGKYICSYSVLVASRVVIAY